MLSGVPAADRNDPPSPCAGQFADLALSATCDELVGLLALVELSLNATATVSTTIDIRADLAFEADYVMPPANHVFADLVLAATAEALAAIAARAHLPLDPPPQARAPLAAPPHRHRPQAHADFSELADGGGSVQRPGNRTAADRGRPAAAGLYVRDDRSRCDQSQL